MVAKDTDGACMCVFERAGMQANLVKTKEMVCTHGFIWGQKNGVLYKQRETGGGGAFRKRNSTQVSCY